VGDTIEEMFDRAWAMEENARLLWEASSMGEIVPLPREGLEPPRGAVARTMTYYANLDRPIEEQRHQAYN